MDTDTQTILRSAECGVRSEPAAGAAFYELRAAMRCDDAAIHCRNGKRFLAREALRAAIEFLNEAEIED